jgi:hypothetical protein
MRARHCWRIMDKDVGGLHGENLGPTPSRKRGEHHIELDLLYQILPFDWLRNSRGTHTAVLLAWSVVCYSTRL